MDLSGGGPLRAAVIGAGFVGPHHVDAVRRGGYAEVVALVGTDPDRTAARARELGVPRGADLAEVLADDSISVVHVCTPNATHAALATALLEAGKHVVVEKPLALTATEAAGLASLAERAGRHAAVAFTYRGYPMVREARALVDRGELGSIRLAHGSYLQDWLLEETDYNWRLEVPAGGASRAVADIGSHWFDTMEFVTGSRVESVFADFATFMPTRRRPVARTLTFGEGSGATEAVSIETEDAAVLAMRLTDGARASCVVSQVSPGRKNALALEIAGTRRSVAWQQEEPERLWLGSRESGFVAIPRPQDTRPTPGVPSLPPGHPEGWGEALRDLFRPFYAAIASGESPVVGPGTTYPTFTDGARAVAFVEAALASARGGGWVTLAPISSEVAASADTLAGMDG